LGRYDEAFAKITEALARRGKGGDKRSIAASLSNLGNVQQDRGQFEAALNCHQEALSLRRAAGDRLGVIVSQNNLSVLRFQLGHVERARGLAERALAVAVRAGLREREAMALLAMGQILSGSLFDADRTVTEGLLPGELPADDFFRRGTELLKTIGNDAEYAK